MDGDGYDDLLIGALGNDSFRGRIYVFYGSSSGLASSPATTLTGDSGEQLGYAFAVLGDSDGDGDDDLLVGCYSSTCGTVELYNGDLGGMSTSASTLTSSLSYFGNQVDPGGDLNGDGYADALVGGTYHVLA